ncbi:MAG: hypothetical protein PHY93_10990 [Bacteriovorax sp.]|nr:hypothetical protein [Bacteriovorax sp.]
MKLALRTLAFLVFSILIAFLGKFINTSIVASKTEKKIIRAAEIQYREFIKHYDPQKKTIVVVGTSTSLYSFTNDSYHLTKDNYVDNLRPKANVINLSSVELQNVSQANTLINFVKTKIPNIDLIVLENLRYFTPFNNFKDYSNLNLLIFCGKESLMYSLSLGAPSADTLFYLNQCQKFRQELSSNFKNTYFIANPCLIKNHKILKFSLFLTPKKRVQLLSGILRCSQDFFYSDQVQQNLIHLLRKGYFEDLNKIFNSAGLDIYALNEVDYTDELKAGDLIFTNRYLHFLLNKYSENKFVIIPAFANRINDLNNIPVFKNDNNRMILLDISEEILKRRKEKKLKFGDIFPDGSHSRNWVQQLLADRIISKFLKEIKD